MALVITYALPNNVPYIRMNFNLENLEAFLLQQCPLFVNFILADNLISHRQGCQNPGRMWRIYPPNNFTAFPPIV